MGAELDLDDVAARSPLAMRELAELRAEIDRLRSALHQSIELTRQANIDRGALQARIDGSQIVKATSAGNVRPEPRMTYIGKRVALVVLEDGK